MAHGIRSKKRPCRICKKWYSPDLRVGDRQQTCGSAECKRQWHAKQCAEWNRKHRSYFQENYLNSKLEAVKLIETKAADNLPTDNPASTKNTDTFSKYPRRLVQEVIGMQQLVIIDYIVRLLFRSFKEVISIKPLETTKETHRLLPEECLRGDGICRSP